MAILLALLAASLPLSSSSDLNKYLASQGHLIPLTTLSHGQGVAIVAYKATIDVGTPAQRVSVILDTGSSALAVALPNCKTREQHECTLDSAGFVPNNSSSYHQPRHLAQHKVTMTYDQGGWSGYRGRDVISFPTTHVQDQLAVHLRGMVPVSTRSPQDTIAADMPVLRFDALPAQAPSPMSHRHHPSDAPMPFLRERPFASVSREPVASLQDLSPGPRDGSRLPAARRSPYQPVGSASDAIPLELASVLGRSTPPKHVDDALRVRTSPASVSAKPSTVAPPPVPSHVIKLGGAKAPARLPHHRHQSSKTNPSPSPSLPEDLEDPLHQEANVKALRHAQNVHKHLSAPVGNANGLLSQRLTVNSIQEAWTIFTVDGHQGVLGLSPRADLLSEHASFAMHLQRNGSILWLASGNSSTQAQQWAEVSSRLNATAISLISSPKALHYQVPFTAVRVGTRRVPLPSLPNKKGLAKRNHHHAIVDSGTTFLLVPQALRLNIVRHLSALVEVNPAIWTSYCVRTHPGRWPELQLELGGGAWISIPGKDYLIQQSPGFYCLGIGISSEEDEIILGLTVLKSRWIALNPLSALFLVSPRDLETVQLPTANTLCNWARDELPGFKQDVSTCSSDCHASATGYSYCHGAMVEVFVNGQRHRFDQQRLTWAGVTRARVYQSVNVEMVVTCPAAAYYPLQCYVELEVAWVTTLMLGLLACGLMRSIWVTTRELQRLQHEEHTKLQGLQKVEVSTA
eukprot:m.129656 g.129656  ORF g.129656 m.129656 type:complete len:743 (-) comp15854_c0_seq1:43-2271(-)